jgi:polyribonucleotide nucleotidyltransferase
MIEKGLFLTGCDAELLDRALTEVKTKAYEESEAQLDDAQALDTLVSHYRNAVNDSQKKEIYNSFFSPLRKRLVLGTIIDRQVSADSRKV